MTKSDLLALLADISDDTLLMVAGHESGLNPLAVVKPVLVERVDTPDYYGDFMLSETGTKAVVFSDTEERYRRMTAADFASFQASTWGKMVRDEK